MLQIKSVHSVPNIIDIS